jgi:hypothetical protein
MKRQHEFETKAQVAAQHVGLRGLGPTTGRRRDPRRPVRQGRHWTPRDLASRNAAGYRRELLRSEKWLGK